MLWTIVGCVAVGITALIAQSSAQKAGFTSDVIKRSIDKGDDPIAAKCAILLGESINITPQELAICMSVKKR